MSAGWCSLQQAAHVWLSYTAYNTAVETTQGTGRWQATKRTLMLAPNQPVLKACVPQDWWQLPCLGTRHMAMC